MAEVDRIRRKLLPIPRDLRVAEVDGTRRKLLPIPRDLRMAEVDGNRTRRTSELVPTALKAAAPTRRADTSAAEGIGIGAAPLSSAQ
ncbi:MAG: hypothetical protein RL391_9 [Actinomycetota bacterium]